MSGTPKLGSYDDLPGAPRTCCERYKTKEKCKCSNQAYPPCKYRTPHPNKCAWCAVASDRCRVSNPAQRACVCMLYTACAPCTVDSVVSPFPTRPCFTCSPCAASHPWGSTPTCGCPRNAHSLNEREIERASLRQNARRGSDGGEGTSNAAMCPVGALLRPAPVCPSMLNVALFLEVSSLTMYLE